MPNWKELFVAVGQLLQSTCVWFFRAAQKHTAAFLASAFVVLALMTAWSWYLQWRTIEFVILVGPGGGGTVEHAKQLSRKIAENSSSLGYTYVARVDGTEGSEEIRRRISEDRTGRMVGFGHDGFGSASNVRILLPLDRNYVFILARRDFLKKLGVPTNKKVRFVDLATKENSLKAGRIFLGPPGSGTRQLAELVLSRYELDPVKYSTNGVTDWTDMRAALNNKRIDVAFYSGPLDADVIQKISSDKSSVLVGLDGDRGPIVQGRIHVLPANIEAKSFSNDDFCPEKIETIASRRVLICSPMMADRTAYMLSTQAHLAMRDVVPEIDWNNPPPDAPRTEGLTFQLHPGAQLHRDKTPPGIFTWNTNYILLTLALWLSTELATSLNRRFGRSIDSPPSPPDADIAEPSSVINEPPLCPPPAGAAITAPISRETLISLERDIYVQLFDDFLELPTPPTRSQRTAWNKHIVQLRDRVLNEFQEGRISERDSEALLAAIEKVDDALSRRQPAETLAKKPLREKG